MTKDYLRDLADRSFQATPGGGGDGGNAAGAISAVTDRGVVFVNYKGRVMGDDGRVHEGFGHADLSPGDARALAELLGALASMAEDDAAEDAPGE